MLSVQRSCELKPRSFIRWTVSVKVEMTKRKGFIENGYKYIKYAYKTEIKPSFTH